MQIHGDGVSPKHQSKQNNETRGVSRIFERGGPISLGSLKKRSSDFKRGGQTVPPLKVQCSEGGGPVHLSHLTMTANLAYLDAKNELTCTLNLKYQ